jgi:hypothetical protein
MSVSNIIMYTAVAFVSLLELVRIYTGLRSTLSDAQNEIIMYGSPGTLDKLLAIRLYSERS